MVRHNKFAAPRVRTAIVAVALMASGMTAAVATSQSASAVGPVDQLVVADVSSATSSALSATSLLTFNTSGSASFAAPVPLPTADSGSDKAFTLSGSSNGNGSLALSANSNFLSIAGYNHIPGPTGFVDATNAPIEPKSTTASQINRMVARVSATGTVDTSTVLGTGLLNGSAPRSAVSNDGTSFYISGNGGNIGETAASGVDQVALGASTGTAIAPTTQKNVRQVQIAGGGLYLTSDKKNLFGLGKFAVAGLPTVASTAITQLAATSTATNNVQPGALLMLHTGASGSAIDTAYVVIDSTSLVPADPVKGTPELPPVAGEIRKYTLSGGIWSLNGTKAGDYPFLTGRVNTAGTAVQLYAANGNDSGNTLVSFDDSGLAGA
ncbi:MAG: hypothetical protein ABIR57_04715, partial [Aeromicrobium sp.]